MSKRPATAVVVAAGLVAGCLLGTAPAGAATNVAAGAGQAGTVQFAFSVQDGPNGPSGHAVLRDPVLGEAQGDVICLRRTGSQGVFWIERTRGSGWGRFVGIIFMDIPGRDHFEAIPSAPSASCVLESGRGGDLVNGNIVVP